jgi:hypothetical protein
MGETGHGDLPAALGPAQRRIEQWRQGRRHRTRIPEELWREAAQLACAHGVHRTAKALRLDYYSLKKHAAAAARSGERVPEFVEILSGGMPTARPECTIEVEDASGAKMRIHLQGGEFPDIVALTGAFWACRGDALASRGCRS